MAVDRCTVDIPRLQIRVDSPPPVAPAPAARGQQHIHRQQQHTGYTGKTSPLSPVQGSKLPPLNHSAVATAAAGDPSRVALQKASDEVGEAMKHLLGEVSARHNCCGRYYSALSGRHFLSQASHGQSLYTQLPVFITCLSILLFFDVKCGYYS